MYNTQRNEIAFLLNPVITVVNAIYFVQLPYNCRNCTRETEGRLIPIFHSYYIKHSTLDKHWKAALHNTWKSGEWRLISLYFVICLFIVYILCSVSLMMAQFVSALSWVWTGVIVCIRFSFLCQYHKGNIQASTYSSDIHFYIISLYCWYFSSFRSYILSVVCFPFFVVGKFQSYL